MITFVLLFQRFLCRHLQKPISVAPPIAGCRPCSLLLPLSPPLIAVLYYCIGRQ